MKKYISALVLLLATLSLAFAQQKITVEDIYSKGTFRVKSVRGINWMQDGQFYTSQNGNNIVKNDVTTGETVEVLVEGKTLSPSIQIEDYSFSQDESKMLLMTERTKVYRRSYKAEFYIYDLVSKKLQKLSEGGKQSYATFSPDGSMIAFVRDNNLFYTTLSDMKEVQVTNDGKFNHIINGSADWVYEEELYLTKAFDWSPDNQKLAYYTFDESEVREYNMQVWNNGALYPEDYRFKYPKAGEANSKITINVFHLANQEKVKMDIGSETDIYIPRISWTKNPDVLSIRRMNRLQNQLDILHGDPKTGKTEVILTEKSKTYISINQENMKYLEDGEHFVLTSEKDGFNHIYLYDISGKLVKQVTNGNWEVSNFIGVDQSVKKPMFYFTSTEVSPLERHFYSIDLDGKKKQKLTEKAGIHSIDMSRDFKYYIKSHSSSTETPSTSLHKVKKNELIKVLQTNEDLTQTCEEFGFVPKEMFQFTTSENVELNGYMLKPKDFEESKEYPVLIFQYSGPGSQQVLNNWGGRANYNWHQLLVQEGYIIAVIDSRGTGARGADFKKVTYGQLGKYETIDMIESAKYLADLKYIDSDRIGIWGWSYGGYMSSLALMQGAEYFKMAIAVAPVSTWRFYDTIYTERYLKRPQDNASGYDDNSPLSHVEKLKGKFLLIHGTGDDNVHFQNSVALQNALINAGKPFDSFYYPDKAHGISGMTTREHLFKKMTKFVLENL